MSPACPSCKATALRPFFDIPNVPANSCILLDSAAEARAYPRGDIKLAFCHECGFITNTAFDARLLEYGDRYEETQSASPTFVRFHEELARSLVHLHDLRHKTILEIGCGKGEFLRMLVEMGDNIGVGYDPAYDEARLAADQRMIVHKKWFSELTPKIDVDLVVCKMTLEHIPNVLDFMTMLRHWLGEQRPTVFFQVPETGHTLNHNAFWDIQYEHCSYFVPASLVDLFRRSGFTPTDTTVTYGGQYLTIEALPGEPQGGMTVNAEPLAQRVKGFAAAVGSSLGRYRDYFVGAKRDGRRVALWGSGAKATALLGALDLKDEIGCVVDINPKKHGKFVAGTGQEIVAPEHLKEYQPHILVIMNPVYHEEIAAQVTGMGLRIETITSMEAIGR